VKALDGVSFEMWEGETLGLVGETGCGKSVTALSILRLIPQPPGKIEEGEVLFNVPEATVAAIEAAEGRARDSLRQIYGDAPEARPPDFSLRRLQTILPAARKVASGKPEYDALRAAAGALMKLKQPHDLLAKSDDEMREIRGNDIAMIFQDPMQALNPVFPIGDQIAENILLHQRQAVASALVGRMERGEGFGRLLPRPLQLWYYRRIRDHPDRGVMPTVRKFLSLHPAVRAALFPVTLALGVVDWVDDRIFGRTLRSEATRWAIDMLRRVKISDPERIAGQYPYELSGGMQQRALIAIALSCNPRLLIADEPTTALDVTIQAQILELIKEMKASLRSSVLLITHDLGIIAEMCKRVCVMYAGHIIEDASVRAVFKAPLHPYTQGLMKAIPSHTVRRERLEIIKGSVPNLITPPPGCRFHPRCPAVMPTCGWSPSEVAEQLRQVLRTGRWSFDPDGLVWETSGTAELVVRFPEGARPPDPAGVLRKAVEMGRSHPAIGAVVSVEPEGPGGDGVSIRILAPRKPPEFEPEPNHYVACLLYEPGAMPAMKVEAHGG
jgi:oligopeptide/dipeptide ABC transporter ATP-binding protein